jgi:predicted nucleic acid-binding protein
VADVLIGALALRHDGLITRNGDDFLALYPKLRIVDPTAHQG